MRLFTLHPRVQSDPQPRPVEADVEQSVEGTQHRRGCIENAACQGALEVPLHPFTQRFSCELLRQIHARFAFGARHHRLVPAGNGVAQVLRDILLDGDDRSDMDERRQAADSATLPLAATVHLTIQKTYMNDCNLLQLQHTSLFHETIINNVWYT